MVTLPDGTYLIMNGAQQGVAGFGLATDPNMNAILYDPSQPVGSRFSILGSTSIARMYHSESTVRCLSGLTVCRVADWGIAPPRRTCSHLGK